MKSRFYLIALTLLLLAAMSTVAVAQDYEEGIHYERLDPPVPTSTGDKVEIVELFWYGCPHCFRFEPYIERFVDKLPKGAEFVRVPGILRPSWEPHARAFYVSELMGVFDKTHMPLFNALHLQKRPVMNQDQLRDFFGEQGVDKVKFLKTYRSFAVETKIRRAKQLASAYRVNGVPVVIINGKYKVSSTMTGSNAETLKVMNYLVNKELKK